MANPTVGITLAVDGAARVVGEFDRVGTSMGALERGAAGLRAAFGSLGGTLAGAVSAKAFIDAADSVTTLQNQLRLATGSVRDAASAYGDLYKIAQQSRVSFTELGSTFAAISRAGAELGVSQARLLTVTQAIGNAMAISGGSAESMKAALVQLGQGLASGTLRGEELNSIMEQTPRLAKALADGLGVTTGELRKLGEQGALTAEQVIAALEKAGPQLIKEVESSVTTVGQAMTVLKNSAVKLAGDIDATAGATAHLAAEIVKVSQAIDEIGQNQVVLSTFKTAGEAIRIVWSDVAFTLGTVGREIGGIAAQAAAIARGDFAGAAAIRQMLIADGKAARAALDKYQAGVLAPKPANTPEDPTTVAFKIGGMARERWARQQAAAEADLAAIRGKLYGVDKDYLPTLQKLQGMRESGVVTEREFIALASELAKANFKKAESHKDSTNAYVAEQDAARVWADTMGDAAKIALDAQTHVDGLSKAQSRLVEYLLSPAYATNSEDMRQAAIAALSAAHAKEQLVDAEKAYQQYLKDSAAYTAAWAEAERDTTAAALARVAAAQAEYDAHNQLRSAVEAVTLAQLEQSRELAALAGEDTAAIDARIAAQRRLIDILRRGEARDATEKAAKDAAEAWQKAAEQINDSITDALMRGFENGKSFAQNLRDTVVNMFKSMVLRPVVSAIVSPIGLALAGGTAAGAANAAGNSLVGNVAGSAGASWLTSGFGAVTSQLTAFGQAAAASTANMLGLSGAADAYAATMAANTAAGMGTASSIGAAVPYVAAAVAALAALGVFRSTRTTETGVMGTMAYGASDFGAYHTTRKSGFLFGGPEYTDVRDPMAAAQQTALNRAFDSIYTSTEAFATALGLPTEAIRGYTTSLKINTIGMTAEAAQAEITKRMGELASGVAQSAFGDALGQFQLAGENYADTLSRLAGSTTTVDAIYRDLGFAIDAFGQGLDGANIKSQLIAIAGGMDAFKSKLQGFYANFYTTAEQQDNNRANVRRLLTGAGVTYTDADIGTNAAYRALVERYARDTTAAGLKAYNTLLDASGLVASYAGTAQDAAQTIVTSFNAVPVAVDKAADALKDFRDTALGMADRLLTSAQAVTFKFANIANDLITAGSPYSNAALVDAMQGMSIGQLREWAVAFAATSNASAEAKTAVLQAADAIISIKEAAQAAYQSAQQTVAGQYHAIVDTYNTAADALQAEQDKIVEGLLASQDRAADILRGIGSSIGDFVKTLDQTDLGGLTKVAQLANLQADFAIQKAAALAGSSTAAGKLTGLAQQILDAGQQTTGSRVDYMRLVAQVKNGLADVQNGADALLTAAGAKDAVTDPLLKELDAHKRWLMAAAEAGLDTKRAAQEYLLQQTDYGKDWRKANDAYLVALGDKNLADQMVDGLNVTLKTPLEDLAAAIKELAAASASLRAADRTGHILNTYQGVPTSQVPVADRSYVNPVNQQVALAGNTSTLDLATIRSSVLSTIERGYVQEARNFLSAYNLTPEQLGIPAFAIGTNYVPRDMLAQIHEGEAIVPKAYNPAAGGAQADEQTAEEIRALRAEQAAQARAMAQIMSDLRKTIRSWDRDGRMATDVEATV